VDKSSTAPVQMLKCSSLHRLEKMEMLLVSCREDIYSLSEIGAYLPLVIMGTLLVSLVLVVGFNVCGSGAIYTSRCID
jgi:hypothetical protein